MYAFLMNGENLDLAKNEILALSKPNKYDVFDRILTSKIKFNFKRLAYTHKVYELIDIKKSVNDLKNINFSKYYNKSFSVRIIRIPSNIETNIHEKQIGSIVWEKLKNPKVDLKNPFTKFEFLFTKECIFICKLIYELDKKELVTRNAKFRPGFHPSSMNSNFARALVNLTGIKEKQIFMDPFCGVGGILIEAGKLGCKIVGSDINPEMIHKCKQNLDYFKIKNYKLSVKDALTIKDKADAIATDFPYGLHSSLHGRKINELYQQFIVYSKKILKKGDKMVLVMPSTINLNYFGYKLNSTILHRIHKGLTRKILVLEKS